MAIDPERLKEIFLEAAEREDEAARLAYLNRVCASDAGLRARVEALLRNHDPEGSFLDTPAAVVPKPDQAALPSITANGNPAVASGSDRSATEAGSTGPDAVPAGHGSTPASSDEEPLTFLAPPQRPGSLGRIGHYEILQILGRGGFGIVFRAFDEMLQRVVALKVMAPQLAATSPARKRFLREARTSAQLRHENVVQVYEVAEQPLPYLVMEFIPGETLQQKLDRFGPLDVMEVLQIGQQIAEGLAAAHATDLIHRDIKPGNVLLEGGHHKVKITDFGLARSADDASVSQSGMIAGTPMYMAPEQAQGDKLDQRADLFSLGSVLYQMVAGRPPFRANTAVAVLKRIAEDKPRAIREIIPETPQWLCNIIAKLHAKNPDDRYQSAREVADVLADCEAQLKVNARLKDYSRIPRSRARSSGRRKWVAAAAAVLLPVIALVVTEFAGVTRLFRGQPTAADAFADADVKRIATLPAVEQVEEVRQQLMRRNPGFDGKVEHKIEDGIVTEFRIVTDNVTDIAPIPAFNALRVLACSGTWNSGQLADLTPLEGMNLSGLRHLELWNTKVTDAGMVYFKDCNNLIFLELPFTRVSDAGLIHFKDCKTLTHLELGGTKVGDAETTNIKNFKDLTHLYLYRTKVSDAYLAQLKGMPLKVVWIYHTDVTDLTSLQGMPPEDVRFTPKNITQGLDILRSIKSLKTIGIEFNQSWPAAEFWQRYDQGEFKE
jgi:serine/threonine protein kinase